MGYFPAFYRTCEFCEMMNDGMARHRQADQQWIFQIWSDESQNRDHQRIQKVPCRALIDKNHV